MDHPETTLRLTGRHIDSLRYTATGSPDGYLALAVITNSNRTWSTVSVDELFDRITAASLADLK